MAKKGLPPQAAKAIYRSWTETNDSMTKPKKKTESKSKGKKK